MVTPPVGDGIAALLSALRLPQDFANLAAFRAVAGIVERYSEERENALLVGVSGSQGSGKSTLAQFLELLLARRGRRTAVLSLDDFYLPRAARAHLAREVHPLFATRGVPGTHDIALLGDTVTHLRSGPAGAAVAVPVFDKARDERRPTAEWRRIPAGPKIILLEGWCIGARPQPDAVLAAPVNTLEASEDAEGIWRRHVNERLAGDYADLFATIDRQLFLAAPSFDAVFAWRKRQEDKLRTAGAAGAGLMTDAQLARFVMHYERITRSMLEELPCCADVVLRLDGDQQVIGIEER